MATHEPSREQELFDVARRLTDPRERAEFLGKACAGDAQLRQHVEELLRWS